MNKYFIQLFAASALLWTVSTASVSAAEYSDVHVTIVADNQILSETTEYVSSDGCTVTDSDGEEQVITGTKAVCALSAASQAAGLPLKLTYEANFVDTIGQYTNYFAAPTASVWWSSYINGESATVGVADLELQSGDDLVFTYGNLIGAPLMISVDDTQVVTDKLMHITVLKNDGDGYVPAKGATVFANDWQYITDAQGHSELGSPVKSVKHVHAELEGYTRSTPVEVRIYKKHKTAPRITTKKRHKMAVRGLASLVTPVTERTVSSSPSLRDWATMALAADGQTGTSLSSASQAASTDVTFSTELARRILALTSNKDFKSARLQAKVLVAMQEPCTDGFVNDEIYTVLALRSVSTKKYHKAVKSNIVCALKSQTKNGGVALSTGGDIDTDTTAVFIEMLASIAQPETVGLNNHRMHVAIKRAKKYLKRNQNPDGGWGYTSNKPSNTSSTATVLMGLTSIMEHPERVRTNKRNGYHFLKHNQKHSGAFRYDNLGTTSVEEINTAFASMALLGTYLPVNRVK